MASCENPVGRDEDEPMHVEDSDSDESHDEIRTPSSRKRKEADGGSTSKSGKKTRSWVWNHFARLQKDNDKAKCHHCGKEMICPSKIRNIKYEEAFEFCV